MDVRYNPVVTYSLKLLMDLTYEMWYKGRKLRNIKNDLPDRITTYSLLNKAVAILKSKYDESIEHYLFLSPCKDDILLLY